MEVPVTQFRKNIFSLMNQALEGGEVWITHKGRRLKIVPEGQPVNKLSRITPMDIIASGVDLEDDSWKVEMMRDWERSWDRQFGALSNSTDSASSSTPPSPRKTRLKA